MDLEKRLILENAAITLFACDHNKTKAAKTLGVTYRTLDAYQKVILRDEALTKTLNLGTASKLSKIKKKCKHPAVKQALYNPDNFTIEKLFATNEQRLDHADNWPSRYSFNDQPK
jgi:hypothetical protein